MKSNLKVKPSHNNYLIILFLIIAILIPRLIGLDKYVTVDEPSWVGYGANTYYALGQRDIDAIVTKYSPGIPTIWFGVASIHLLFPEYRGFGQGYLWNDDLGVVDIMSEHSQSPMGILVAARIFSIIVVTAALLMIFIYSRRLFGILPAIISVLLISFEPFYLGHTRLLTHEGLISPLLVLSIISYVSFLYQGRKKVDLFLSAFAGSVACLTKSTSTIIVLFIALISVIAYFEFAKKTSREENKSLLRFHRIVQFVLIWLLVFAVIYIALWPPMWIAPVETLKHIYGSVLEIVVSDGNSNVGADSVETFNSINSNGFQRYLNIMITKTSPLVWLGFWIGLLKELFNRKTSDVDGRKRTVFYLFLFGVLFYFMMSLAANKIAFHYIMTTVVCLTYIAGIGLAYILQWVKGLGGLWKSSIAVLLAALILYQAYTIVSYYPYFYPYVNPISTKINRGILAPAYNGYGEGLDLAAKYLSEKPNPENIRVMSWFAGIPGYLFPGKVRHIKSLPEWSQESASKLSRSDYLVIYYELQRLRNVPEKLMSDLAQVPPEHTIFLYGYEYIRIYRVSELPDSVFVPDNQIEN